MPIVTTICLPSDNGKVKVRFLESDAKELVRNLNCFVSQLTFERFAKLAKERNVPYEQFEDSLKVWVPIHATYDGNHSELIGFPLTMPDLTADINGFDNAAYSEPWEPGELEQSLLNTFTSEPIGIPANSETVRAIERRILQKVYDAFRPDEGIPHGLCRLFSEYGL